MHSQRAGRPSHGPFGTTTAHPESTRLCPLKPPPKHDLHRRPQQRAQPQQYRRPTTPHDATPGTRQYGPTWQEQSYI